MNNFKKVFLSVTSSLVVLSMSTSIFASNSYEGQIWSSPTNLNGERPISTYVPNSENNDEENIQTLRIDARSVTFVHNSGFDRRANGNAGQPSERVWGETSHVENGVAVDGYTRARYELGSSIKHDSGRCWDSDDGTIDGYSRAVSGWTTNATLYVGHTYYGN